MSNIFQTGEVVSGESFIGRKKIVDKLKKAYIDNPNSVAKSIIGLTRIGKTSIVKKVFTEVEENTCYVYENLNEWNRYEHLWQDICYQIEEYLNKYNITSDRINECIDAVNNRYNVWPVFLRSIKEIFRELARKNIKTILVLDEFDNASTIFCEQDNESGVVSTQRFELFRTIFSDGNFNVSALTISRRNLYTIEGATYQSSTFHGVLDSIYLLGFDDDDMEEYYEVFKKYNIELSEEDKESIEYYAGRSPYLLSILGHYIVEEHEDNNDIDIDKIFKEKCKTINDYYKDCIKHLERDNDLIRIIPFIIGPNIGVNKNDKDELMNLGYLKEKGGKLIAISEHFRTFLSNNVMNIKIWDNIIELEKQMKLLLKKEFINVVNHYEVGGDNIRELERNIFSQVDSINPGDIARYDNFITSNKKVFDVDSSYLDVISLTDTLKVIKECWDDVFSKYFDNDLYDSWKDKFNKCSLARNPVAHGHEEYLTELDKNEVDIYCKQIWETISSNNFTNAVMPEESEILDAASKYDSPDVNNSIEFEEPINDLIGQEVEFTSLKIGGSKRNNLSGYILEKYKTTIPADCLTDIDIHDAVKEKRIIKGIVDRIDGDHYLLRR